MFFIECKTIPQVYPVSTIVYANNQCVIQFIEDGEVNLIEYIVPVLHTDYDTMEVSKCILKKIFQYV